MSKECFNGDGLHPKKPTKECKHEELLGADYTDDCSVKLFGHRDKKGVTHITREEILQNNISKKDFIESKIKGWDIVGKKSGLYDACVDCDILKDFLTSSINEAWEKSKEEERHDNEILVNTILDTKNQELHQQKEEARQLAITNERERIRKWAEKKSRRWNIDIECKDLLQELQNK